MSIASRALRADREFCSAMQTLHEQLAVPKPLPVLINGLPSGAAEAFCVQAVAEIWEREHRPSLLLAPDERTAAALCDILAAELPAALFPTREPIFYQIASSHDIERERLSVLSRLWRGALAAVVASPAALLRPVMPPEELAARSLCLSVGDEMPPDTLCRRLVALGYARVETVESAGQFARRGGIVDLYPQEGQPPVRLEFFGDEIDRMGEIDPITQRVTEGCDRVELLPAREMLADEGQRAALRTCLSTGQSKAKEGAQHELALELAAIDGGEELHFLDRYAGLLFPRLCTLADYFGEGGAHPVFLLGSNGVFEGVDGVAALDRAQLSSMLEEGLAHPRYTLLGTGRAEFDAFLARQLPVHVNSLSGGLGSLRCAGLFGFRCRRTPSYADTIPLLCDDLRTLIATHYRVLLCCRSDGELNALRTALDEGTIPATRVDGAFDIATAESGTVYLCLWRQAGGFELMNCRVAVLTLLPDGNRAAQRRRRTVKQHKDAGQRILSYADLHEGDYVVHVNHGLGIFEGMQTLTVGGVTADYITIRYAGTDKLFLPADRLESIARYIGARPEDGQMKLSRLGGVEWQKAKSRAKAAAREMARELIALYAARSRRPGFAFPPDGAMEEEFDRSFEYEETDGQLAAVADIKADMERPVPMDRLLCGDVGFGKTEVALRAAFKAIAAGKQVAFLVPTTILALQHYETALSRMRGYPVSIEMLSRFRSPKEQQKILRRLARGEIDMVIGTHSLLGRGVSFRDLGLLIVDEEQRFGVAQKEKIKNMAQGVDVLTLTATPIPRTLNMAMSGIRDMSVLDEAPVDRYPVETFVMEHDDLVIADAIRRELARNGQVLYLYNRVENIAAVASRLQNRLPDARVAYAHGQMEREELEDIWQALVAGEIDILVCTTILETGIDLPNANTLVIENADRMGLAQLHQLRGRVGRSGRHAYAYFTYRAGKSLSEVATKRLEAIREFAEFGAGFRVALRDLEIRGAGNLLGAEQHGHIASVGYDLYIRLLNEAVLEERGEQQAPPFECTVDFHADACIPASYIPSDAHRMEMYKKISLIRTPEDRADVLDEFCDRFGEPPRVTCRLLDIALCRARGARGRIHRVDLREGLLHLLPAEIDLAAWSELFCERAGMRFGSTRTPEVICRLGRGEDAAAAAAELLGRYVALHESSAGKENATDEK